MSELPDPDWYLDNVLVDARPGGPVAPILGPAATWHQWWQTRLLDQECRAARDSGFVLMTGELAEAGITRARGRHALRTGRWTTAARGAVGVVDVRASDRFLADRRRHALVAAASARGRPGQVVSGRSAAVLHGLPTRSVPVAPELTASLTRWRGARNQNHVFAAALPDAAIGSWFGIAVTTVARTLVDLARHDRRDAIMAADAALRERLTTVAMIETELDAAVGWPGVRRAREVLRLADPRAESPLESLVRLALHDDGFPVPDLQVWFGRDRVDLYLERSRVVIEADGRVKYTGDQLWDEKLREQRLRRRVRRIERVTWNDVTSDWPATSQRLRAAMSTPSSPQWS